MQGSQNPLWPRVHYKKATLCVPCALLTGSHVRSFVLIVLIYLRGVSTPIGVWDTHAHIREVNNGLRGLRSKNIYLSTLVRLAFSQDCV